MGRTFSTNPTRGDVIVFDATQVSSAGSGKVIKRVVATGGETVQFREGSVYVDELEIYEPYLAEPNATRSRSLSIPRCDGTPATDRCVVPDGHVFVMGDNRVNSQDSRVYGPVPIDAIEAKIFMKVMPFGDIAGL